jgi:hypothetical protein
MLKHVILPEYIKRGVGGMVRGFPSKLKLMVWDTETINGDPYSCQFFDGETAVMSYQKQEDVLTTFIKYVRKRQVPGYQTYIFAHGLDFDLPVLFHAHHKQFIKNQFYIRFDRLGAEFECFTGKMTFAKMYTPEGMVYIYDTFRFVLCSLAKACEDLRLPVQKLPRPPYLGQREPTREERPSFEKYAMADVYALWELVLWIVERARELDTPIPISIAQLASLVFKKKFMPKPIKIPKQRNIPKQVITLARKPDTFTFPPKECVIDSIRAYHGGKNGLYTKAPTLLRNINGYDINSAYPWAMKTLPSFLGGEYKQVRKFHENKIGIYTISGDYYYETHPLFYQHDFEIQAPGRLENLCITSFELERALSLRWFIPSRISGWIFYPSETYSPLAEYVNYFYEQKQKLPKTHAGYWVAKNLMNSLYGKFIQSTNYDATESIVSRVKKGVTDIPEQEFLAGGLFNPFIASVITGMVRTRLFDYELRYNALHSSTDAILTREQAETSSELGGLKFENEGDCLLLRNKLYLHTDGESFEKVSLRAIVEKDRAKQAEIWGKFALHGYQGDIPTLLNLWKTRSIEYKINRMVRLKESFKHKNLNLKPLTWVDMPKTLDVDWTQYTEEKKP